MGANSGVAQETGWAIRQSAAADLWFHGLAVLGFGAGPSVRAYDPDYVADVIRSKRDKGVFPTELDEKAEELREGEFGSLIRTLVDELGPYAAEIAIARAFAAGYLAAKDREE